MLGLLHGFALAIFNAISNTISQQESAGMATLSDHPEISNMGKPVSTSPLGNVMSLVLAVLGEQ